MTRGDARKSLTMGNVGTATKTIHANAIVKRNIFMPVLYAIIFRKSGPYLQIPEFKDTRLYLDVMYEEKES